MQEHPSQSVPPIAHTQSKRYPYYLATIVAVVFLFIGLTGRRLIIESDAITYPVNMIVQAFFWAAIVGITSWAVLHVAYPPVRKVWAWFLTIYIFAISIGPSILLVIDPAFYIEPWALILNFLACTAGAPFIIRAIKEPTINYYPFPPRHEKIIANVLFAVLVGLWLYSRALSN